MNDLSDFSKYLTDEELAKVAPMLERLQTLDKRVEKQDNYMSFVKHVWPQFIEGRHHKIYAEKLQAVADGKIKRLIINMPPRHTKSEFASYLFPTWLMGRRPDLKIIQATHTAELAVGFGRKVKNLIDSEEFRDVFPNVSLRQMPRRVVVGVRTAVVSIMRWVWAALWRVAARIWRLLTTPFRNKTR